MRLSEFREKTAHLPDDAEIVLWEDGDTTWYEVNIHQEIPANPIERYPVLVLDLGQRVELEFDLAVRTGIDEL